MNVNRTVPPAEVEEAVKHILLGGGKESAVDTPAKAVTWLDFAVWSATLRACFLRIIVRASCGAPPAVAPEQFLIWL